MEAPQAPGCIVSIHPKVARFALSRCGRAWVLRSGYGITSGVTPPRWVEVFGWVDPDGHRVLCTSIDGRRVRIRVHTLILETFVGPRPEGMMCCHANDDPGDNRACNLRWDTIKSNARDAIRNGRILRGERCHTAKLSPSQVEEIRERHARGGISQEKLGAEYGVNQTVISKIVRRQSWTHI